MSFAESYLKGKAIAYLIILLVLVVCGYTFYSKFCFDNKFADVTTGMTEQAAIHILGRPDANIIQEPGTYELQYSHRFLAKDRNDLYCVVIKDGFVISTRIELVY